MTDLDKRKQIDPEIVRKFLDYDPTSGALVWRWRGLDFFPSKRIWAGWNGRYAGREAFTAVSPRGYRYGAILSRAYQAHRVAYAHFHGVNPPSDVDHIDGDGLNNCIHNLRLASRFQNMQNVRRHKDKDGLKGAYWRNDTKRWEAKIRANGTLHRLGFFPTEAAAHEAYCAASARLHGEYGRAA
jgi:hypothetical protein